MDDKKAYKQILKSTSLLGSVQVMSIIIGIIRMKFVAVLLSTTGMGTLGLYNTTLSLIQTATSLGLSSSGVRDVANANELNDGKRIAKTVKVLRRWVLVSGFFGLIVTIFLSSFLSKWVFNSQEHTWSFVYLSIVCLLTSINNGQNVLLQGIRKLKQMAKSTLFGTILGLVISIPLYNL
jgi:O-antigen/teichoic acid export membrane protein